ncbi:MAG: DUF3108 domain-containing protein [Gemmatimonadaceae bacterium]
MNRLTMFSGITTLALASLGAFAVTPASAQSAPVAAFPQAPATPQAVVPFGVGEQLDYVVAVGGARVGTGRMAIVDTANVQGHSTYHAMFTVKGGFLMFKVDDALESWFDKSTLSSRRFIQTINEVNYHTKRYYDIYPERSLMQQKGDTMKASVSDPLDDASFLYFVRTVPLEVGQTYTYQRYFRPDKNPVIVKVLRRETVTVPAGTFNTVVIQPIIKSGGLFAEGGEAQMWLTDDSRRMMVQFKAKIPVLKTLDLYLTSFRPPNTEAASAK